MGQDEWRNGATNKLNISAFSFHPTIIGWNRGLGQRFETPEVQLCVRHVGTQVSLYSPDDAEGDIKLDPVNEWILKQ